MSANSGAGIVVDPDVLSEAYLPPIISERERHIEEIRRCISPALKGQKPLCAWLHGRPGTGKTTVAQHVLSEMDKLTNIGGVYVNCWKQNSFFSVLEYIVNELRRGFGDARDTYFKLSQFERLIKDRPFIVVLDEVDLVPSRERNNMIYNLFGIGKVGLICISESRFPILGLDSRIKSRLNPRVIAFEHYSPGKLVNILEVRAARALHPESWGSEILSHIAEKAQGDARIAIQTLRNAAIYADSERSGKIVRDHIERGFSDTGGLRKTYELKRLTEHHRLLFQIIKKQPGITSPELFKKYLRECEARNWKPIASRTFSLYLQKMTELKIIQVERARVRGRVHSFRVMD